MKLLPIYCGSGFSIVLPLVWVTLFFLDVAKDLMISIGLLWSLPSVLLPGYSYNSLHSILGFMSPSYPAAAFCFAFWFASGLGVGTLVRIAARKRTRSVQANYSERF